ncbi:MAG: MmgE/PrpD family protein [Thermodesulfobacteriota bacterium]
MTLTEEYARFTARLEWSDLPAAPRDLALELFADWFANAAAGLDFPMGRALLELTAAAPGPRPALVVGTLQPAEPLAAALINAAAAHSLEFDDSYRTGLFHPGAPIISAAFAAAGRAEAPGRLLLTAMVAGYEVSLRLAEAVNPAHYQVWHTTGTVGVFGAAAAAARVLGLNPELTAGALGLAGTQAGGLWEVLPRTPLAKNLHPAKAAQSGLLAALLAEKGIKGPATILEGPRGFFSATVPAEVSPEQCLTGLGREWWTLKTTIKAYPVCGHAMTPLEAALSLSGRVEASEIEEIEVRAHPVSIRVAGQAKPEDEYQAKFSIPYCVAVALLEGRVGQEEFAPRVRESPRVIDLLSRIILVPDEELSDRPDRRPARVTVRLANGRTISSLAEVRRGDPEKPLTRADKKEKFLALAGGVWGREAAARLYDAIGDLPQTDNVAAWGERCRELLGRR